VIEGTIQEVLAGDAQLLLYTGSMDCLVGEIPEESVAGIVTDPPYDKKSWYLYDACYEAAQRILVPHGDLLMIMPHYRLNPYEEGFDCTPYPPLKYRWTLAMIQRTGSFPRLCNAHHNLAVTWKPIGWWYKLGPKPNNYSGVVDSVECFIPDSYDNPPPDKKHKWQQSDEWADFCLDHLYFTEGVVVDPMVGSGTLAVRALARGYRVIAGDIDPEAIALARERLYKYLS
jgi:DNA modification methylase